MPGPNRRRARVLFFRGGIGVRPCAQDQLAPGGSRGIPDVQGEGGGTIVFLFFKKKRLKSVEEDEVQHCPIIARLELNDFLNRILVLIYRNKF